MKAESPSRTAEAAAAVRALESLLPEGQRQFEDIYAARFLRPQHRLLIGLCRRSSEIRNFVEKTLDRRFPGVPADFICRTRFIDELIMKEMPALERLVVLGAGYDTRAFRLAGDFHIVEIDHPATQARKAAIARQFASGDTAGRVTRTPHDLMQPPENSALLRETLRLPQRTFWIAEGLLSYLPREAVQRIFRWIAAQSLTGSRVVATYAHRDFLEGKTDDPAAQAIFQYLRKNGESFLTGWTPQEIARDLLELGIQVEQDVSEAELAASYLKPIGRTLKSHKEFRVLSARVVTKP